MVEIFYAVSHKWESEKSDHYMTLGIVSDIFSLNTISPRELFSNRIVFFWKFKIINTI